MFSTFLYVIGMLLLSALPLIFAYALTCPVKED